MFKEGEQKNEDDAAASGPPVVCSACGDPVLGPNYSCNQCSKLFILHKSCAELPREMHHPIHRKHPLVLLPDRYYNCDICRKSHSGLFSYKCKPCDFDLDLQCASNLSEIKYLEHFSHEHALIFVGDPKKREGDLPVVCQGCGERVLGPGYCCSRFLCHYTLHKSCAELPRDMHHPIHRKHPLVLLPDRYYNCDICRKSHSGLFSYKCKPCDFDLDLQCASNLSEIKYLEHFSHEHALIFVENPEKREGDLPVICQGCGERVLGPGYCCSRFLCHYTLHKSCAELPREMHHPIHHKHPLVLLPDRYYSCDICRKSHSGLFSYNCKPCDFDLDLQCASNLSEIKYLEHFSHEHALIFVEDPKRREGGLPVVCQGCQEEVLAPSYCCSRILCHYTLHKSCAEMSVEFHHPRHIQHPLILNKLDAAKQHLCDACDQDCSGKFTYSCFQCHFNLDPQCTFNWTDFKHFSHVHPLMFKEGEQEMSDRGSISPSNSFEIDVGEVEVETPPESILGVSSYLEDNGHSEDMAVGKEEIFKARPDKREYRRIVLPNSLEVLLISDPDTDKCAASMDVSVGSFSDPDGLEGLAHFLEHMLFYASEKHPLEDTYSKYITEHGGRTNAFTAAEHTNFYFDINPDGFEEALDRFAQFFIKPLMSADATTREIKAVDSENQKNLLSDGWRINQLQKHLSAANHPYHKFSTGNWNTLEVQPKAKGLDTRHELIKFYEEYYSANLMHLVIYGKEKLDKIQGLVEDKFKEIRNIDRSCLRFTGEPCTSEHLEILVRTVPIKEGHKLRLAWPITPEIHHYKEGPCRYLGHLIGHEGEGSLYYILKTLGWATGLSAGESDSTLDFAFFKVDIDLTDAGHDHMQDTVGLLFKYISLLQQSGVCKWIFDELSAVCETKFHYQDKIQPINYVVNISSNMQKYPPKDWLVRSSLPSNFSPVIIQMVLNKLSPNNVRIFWESKKFEGDTNMFEPWYGTAYCMEKITGSRIQEWIASSPNENLHLPARNVFIPTDLSLKNENEKVKCPVLLRKSPYATLWYKPDTMFFTPKAYVKIDFNCPHASGSPEAEVLTNIFTHLLMDYLNDYAYYAKVAGLYYGINHTESGFQVTLVGYNHKLRILLETVVEKMASFKVKADRFSVIKEMVTKKYQNYKFQQPYEQAMYYFSLILQYETWPLMEQLEVLPHLEVEDLAKFVPLMLSRAFLECYTAGNLESTEAESMILHVEDVFFKGSNPICQPLFPSQHLTNRVVKLEKGKNFIYPVEGLNPSDENSSLVHYIQVHRDDFMLNVKLRLFVLIAKQPAFHQLRSVEQLGYITRLSQRNDCGIRGLQFIIQSTVKGPGHIDLRVEEFLKTFESKLYEMTNDEFKSNVNTLIDMKLEKHKNLREEAGFYWREISDGTLKFDRKEAEIAALRQLTQQELIEFYNEHIKVGAPRKRTLSVRVYGNPHSSEYASDKSSPVQPCTVKIDDIFTFRRSQPLYGSFKGNFGHVKL